MKRYDMEDSYEPYTGQHQGIVGIESDMGDWCKAEDALKAARQRDMLREALEGVVACIDETRGKNATDALNKANAALKECE